MKKLYEVYHEINKGNIRAFIQLYGLLSGTYEIVSVNPRVWTISIKLKKGNVKYLTLPVSPDVDVYILQ